MIERNLVHFARVLRAAGLSVGPDRVLQAMAAIEAVGMARRDDVHAALSAVMIDRHEQQAIFDAAFASIWRDPKRLEPMVLPMPPRVSADAQPQRLQAAWAPLHRLAAAKDEAAPPNEPRVDTSFTFSERERFQRADFERMSTAEFALAKKMAEEIALPVAPVRRRRHETASRGRLDLRATLLRMARSPHTLTPAFTRERSELPPIVVLLDISGSMQRYSRVFLHYLHGLTRRHRHVHTLAFGTRLTNITRCLRECDADIAMQRTDQAVPDWKGGTRIASCLADFNRHWARRLLGGQAALLLVTDGLDRDENGGLAEAAAQLRRFARQIVWLNPLLRFDAFEPRAAGMRALLPHVDRFLPVHNLASLGDLPRALHAPATFTTR